MRPPLQPNVVHLSMQIPPQHIPQSTRSCADQQLQAHGTWKFSAKSWQGEHESKERE